MRNICAYCGEDSGRYELCRDCYQMSKDEEIVQNEKGKWVKNVRKGNEYKFYDSTKNYKLKKNLLNEWEMKFFNIVRKSLKQKFVIEPQVNLQTIIETNTNTRNDELYRNLDFVVYYAKKYIPFLAIELNGQQHYTNEYWKERDKSVQAILNCAELPLLTIDIKDIKRLNDNEIYKIMNKVIKYLNPNIFQRMFGKKQNKMDLTWAREMAHGQNI